MASWARKTLRNRRLFGWLGAGAVITQVGGCLPDNAFATVLGENITQTFALGLSSISSLAFGLPDSVLNLLVFNLVSQFLGS